MLSDLDFDEGGNDENEDKKEGAESENHFDHVDEFLRALVLHDLNVVRRQQHVLRIVATEKVAPSINP